MKLTILPERLLDIVKTKQDVNLVLAGINEVLSHLFTTTSRPIDVITAYMPYEKKEWVLMLIHEYDLNLTDSIQMQTFFETLRAALANIPVIEITIAFEPVDAFVTTLSDWFVSQCKKPVLLDIKCNLTIIAGAVIAYNGTYKDYSMAKLLKEKHKEGMITY